MIIRRKKGLPMLKEYKKKRTHQLDVFYLWNPAAAYSPMLGLQAQRGVELYSFCRRLLLRQNYRCRQGEQAFVLYAKEKTDRPARRVA